jgi:hypothetical protein
MSNSNSNSNSNTSNAESDDDADDYDDSDDDDDNYDPMAAEFKKRTFSQLQTFPNFSNLKTVEGNRALKRQLTDRSQKAVDRAIKQANTDGLSRVNSLSDHPNQFLFDKNPSTVERVKNIKDRRTLLTEMAARIRSENLEIPQASTKVTFNDTVLSSEIPRVPGADISVAINQERIDIKDKMDTVEKLSSYLADKLFLIDPSEFSEQNLFKLLNSCNNDTDASTYSSFGLSKPAKYRKSDKANELVCDPDAPFTEANLRLLQKYDLLKFTLDKTVKKIEDKQKSFSGQAAAAKKKLTDYINKIRSDIWIAFMSILNLDSSEGGRKTKRNKRRTSKRRTSKRRTSKRRTSKRRTSKRRTSKRRKLTR